MTQFNQIYINNIAEGLNSTVIDATSITPASEAAGTLDIKDTLPRLLKAHTNPYLILNGPCEWFESWSDSRINLKGQTVDFFLYEVLSVWQNHSRYNCPAGIIEEDCVINEFDMIDTWCKKHNCNYRILVNEYNMLEALQNTQYASWPIIHCDSFSLGYYVDNKEPAPNVFYDPIEYKMNCFTYRWDQHRMLACSFMLQYEHNIITHYHETQGVQYKWPIGESKYFNTLRNYKNALQHRVPLSVEQTSFKKFHPSENILPVTEQHLTSTILEDYYLKSFCSLVCETNYEYPWGQLSEKTINPIRFENPFVLLAGPYSLEQAKQWGFKTFDRWWDESYDTEIHPVKRMDKVFDVVAEIQSYSISDLTAMKSEMNEVLLHNRNLIRTGELQKNLMKEIT